MSVLAAVTLMSSVLSMAAPPAERWCIETGMANPAPPLVAELHAADGLEVLAVFPADGVVQCFDARGEILWTHTEDSPAAPVSPAFLSGTLVFALKTGAVVALNPSTGEARWRSESVGEEVLGIALADIDDDDTVEVIATTRTHGVVALDQEGQERWRFEATLSGAPAVMDVNDDGYAEIYVIAEGGPICLDNEGFPLWEADEEGGFSGTPIVGDADADMLYEVYAVAADPSELIAFDADLGDRVWERSLKPMGMRGENSDKAAHQWTPIPAYAAGQLALGDVNGDEVAEIAVSLPVGQTQIVAREAGTNVWDHFRAAVVLANTNRDSRAEYTAAAGTQVFGSNMLEDFGWQIDGRPPAAAAPIICDMDGGGPAAILLTAADGSICLRQASGPYVPSLSPWPMDGANPARTHSVLSPALYEAKENELEPVPESATLWIWQQSKDGEALADVVQPPSEASVTDEAHTLLSPAIPVSPDLREVAVTVILAGEYAGDISLIWGDPGNPFRSDALQQSASGDRIQYRLSGAKAALSAKALRVVAAPGEPDALPDVQQVEVRGTLARVPSVQVFYNQVGYELTASKQFTAWASFPANEGSLAIVSANDKVLFERSLSGLGEQITGMYGNEWEGFYWKGDFTEFDQPGLYRLRVTIENAIAESAPFEIGPHLLWHRLFSQAVQRYRSQRCGEPGANCAPEAGWYDEAAEAAADPAPHVRALARALSIVRWRLEEDATGALAAFEEELRWGTDALLRTVDAHMASEDHEDAALAAAALAIAGRELSESDTILDAAGKLLRHELSREQRSVLLWSAAIDLFIATQDEAYKDIAKSLYEGPRADAPESSVAYETHIDDSTLASFHAAYQMQTMVQPIIASAQNVFGVVTDGTPQNRNWFGTPSQESGDEPAGTTTTVLEAAKVLAQAYRFQPMPNYQNVILGQINWLLGNNPLGARVIAIPDKEKAAPGIVGNGLSGRAPGDDRPVLDVSPPSLLNTARLIEVLANYKRVRLSI